MATVRLLQRLKNDLGGVSIIEWALALPLVSVVLLGVVDVSSCYSAQLSLQQAAARAIERAQVSGSASDYSFIRQEAASAAGVPISQVTLEQWLECNQVRQSASVQSCPSGQATARYVQVSIDATYSPVFALSPLGQRRGSDGSVQLRAASALRVA